MILKAWMKYKNTGILCLAFMIYSFPCLLVPFILFTPPLFPFGSYSFCAWMPEEEKKKKKKPQMLFLF